MNYAIVENGVVINTVVWDDASTWNPPADTTVVVIPDGAYVGIGSTYDGKNFSMPPQPPAMG